MDGDHPRDGNDRITAPILEATALETAASPIWTQAPQGLAPPELAGRHISLTAWALAAIGGIAIWTLIFKLI